MSLSSTSINNPLIGGGRTVRLVERYGVPHEYHETVYVFVYDPASPSGLSTTGSEVLYSALDSTAARYGGAPVADSFTSCYLEERHPTIVRMSRISVGSTVYVGAVVEIQMIYRYQRMADGTSVFPLLVDAGVAYVQEESFCNVNGAENIVTNSAITGGSPAGMPQRKSVMINYANPWVAYEWTVATNSAVTEANKYVDRVNSAPWSSLTDTAGHADTGCWHVSSCDPSPALLIPPTGAPMRWKFRAKLECRQRVVTLPYTGATAVELGWNEYIKWTQGGAEGTWTPPGGLPDSNGAKVIACHKTLDFSFFGASP
jgi:hypothetical protein